MQMVVMVDAHELPSQQLSMELSKAKRRAALRDQLDSGYALVLPHLAISDGGGASEAEKFELAKDLISGVRRHHSFSSATAYTAWACQYHVSCAIKGVPKMDCHGEDVAFVWLDCRQLR